MQKKWLAALLVLAMIIMAFAGCSRQNESLETTKTTSGNINVPEKPPAVSLTVTMNWAGK